MIRYSSRRTSAVGSELDSMSSFFFCIKSFIFALIRDKILEYGKRDNHNFVGGVVSGARGD